LRKNFQASFEFVTVSGDSRSFVFTLKHETASTNTCNPLLESIDLQRYNKKSTYEWNGSIKRNSFAATA